MKIYKELQIEDAIDIYSSWYSLLSLVTQIPLQVAENYRGILTSESWSKASWS